MSKRYQYILILFAVFAIANLSSQLIMAPILNYISKPALLILLSLYFYLQTKDNTTAFSRWIQAGLIFAIAGDVFLMLPGQEQFFLFGLGSFFCTQVCYAVGFSKYRSDEKGFIRQSPWWVLVFLTYLIGLMLFLWKGLADGLQIPVVVYGIAIISMCLATLNLANKLPKNIFIPLLIGVLLFLISDSLIAMNRFMYPTVSIPFPRFLIMLTYILAQYLIATRSVQANELKK
ncbi:MAG: lysoplasmalogenase [Bacteroidetes bacterium]|nr:lysoplasmalogenase [Bacteroidota bacterium]